jgi:hypothetical protein
LVGGQLQPTSDNLSALKTGSLVVTRGVIQALRDDPDRAALVQRLAGELAMSDTVEAALTMRRMLTTGESGPMPPNSQRRWQRGPSYRFAR